MKETIDLAYAMLPLTSRIVGVKLVDSQEEFDKYAARELVNPLSYCVAVAAAGRGHALKFKKETSGCGGSTRALGLVLPDASFYDGTSAYGLGLFANKEISATVSGKMTICKGGTYGVVVKPAEDFEEIPDVYLVVANTRNTMRIVQGYTYFYGMEDGFCMTGNQAVCVEGTAIPIVKDQINVSVFCSGTRFLAGWQDDEMMVGIPSGKFAKTVEGLRCTVNAVEPDKRKEEIQRKLSSLGMDPSEVKMGNTYYVRLEEEKRKARRGQS